MTNATQEPTMSQTTREALKSLLSTAGLEAVLDALRLEMGELASEADEADQDALYAATELVEQAWMTVPECGTVNG
jgi:hypothetical protein